ncbi:hypothetical protein ACIBF5_06470 [Micromonospora sp. NPDC050417]|uniref:hypothetical protein n=1 Tax=Micromonospora sp. NPDC050417 TaxID=3364280 RepID=UPI0037B948ED
MNDMNGRAAQVDTALLDVSQVPPEELWLAGDTVIAELVRELTQDAQQGDDGSTVAAFNSSL